MSQPDDVTAKDSGGGFEPHSEGQFAMVCVDVINLGVNVETFPGQEPREVAKVALVFASGERHDDKSLRLVTSEMTLSANEKANLRKFLEAWRGKTYSNADAEAGLPLAKLYGQAALISIEHVLTRKGRKFAKIASVAPLPKPMDNPAFRGMLMEYQRPKFFTDRKAQYADTLTRHRATMPDDAGIPPEPPPEDDDIPF